MGTGARAHARRAFDPDQQNQRYLSLFTELREKHRPASAAIA